MGSCNIITVGYDYLTQLFPSSCSSQFLGVFSSLDTPLKLIYFQEKQTTMAPVPCVDIKVWCSVASQ